MESHPAAQVRSATAADAYGIAQVHINSSVAAYSGLIPEAFVRPMSIEQRRDRWALQLSDDSDWGAIYVAEVGPTLIGFIFVRFAIQGPGELAVLYVELPYWGAGVGQALEAVGVRALREHGCSAATLWVLEANARARRFYEKCGWQDSGVRKTDTYLGAEVTEAEYRRTL